MTFPYIRPFNIHPSTSGGNVDNTPNTVNWSTIVWYVLWLQGTITSQQITGITNSIDIEIQPGTTNGNLTLYYQVGNSNLTGGHMLNPPSSPWVAITSNTTISINNNQWLSFLCHGSTGSATTATVINKSDGLNTQLDTFSYAQIDTPE